MTYGEALQEILSFESTGVLYQRDSTQEGFEFIELPPTKRGFKANLMSFTLDYCFNIRENTSHLPRKKKKKLELHFNKRYNKLKREIDAMED